MDPRQACFYCLDQNPPALFEAALWIAAEHLPGSLPNQSQRLLNDLARQIGMNFDDRAGTAEQAQWLLRQLTGLGFCEDGDFPPQPRSALLPLVLQRRQGQPLSLALIALELARQLDIPLAGVNFPRRFLLRPPQVDYLLDPATDRRLYIPDCRELLLRLQGPNSELQAAHLKLASPRDILQHLSRNLRRLHSAAGELLAALKDAQRTIELGQASAADHEARANLYRQLDCPQAERYDLAHALLLSHDPVEQLRLSQRLSEIASRPKHALH